MMAGTCRDWPWDDVIRWFRVYGPSMKTLALRGDLLATKCIKAYFDGYKDPRNMEKQMQLRDTLTDYVIRELSQQGRIEMLSKFGHHEQEELAGKIIIGGKTH
jgi:hypothetical protein